MYSLLSDRRVQWQLWAVLFSLAVLMTTLAAHGIFLPGDAALARAVQSAHSIDAFNPVSLALYELGMAPVWPVLTLGLAVFAAGRGGLLPGVFIVVTALVRPLNAIIKEIVERPRPSEAYVSYVEGAGGFAFPSGHVFGTVLLVGFVGYLLVEREANSVRRWCIAAGAGAVILLMGVQRVFAGAHWPTDALAAWLWGGLILFVLVQAYRAIQSRRSGQTQAASSGPEFA